MSCVTMSIHTEQTPGHCVLLVGVKRQVNMLWSFRTKEQIEQTGAVSLELVEYTHVSIQPNGTTGALTARRFRSRHNTKPGSLNPNPSHNAQAAPSQLTLLGRRLFSAGKHNRFSSHVVITRLPTTKVYMNVLGKWEDAKRQVMVTIK